VSLLAMSLMMSNIVVQRFMPLLAPVRHAPHAVGSESSALRLNSSWGNARSHRSKKG
jgi:hypothetical protein